MQGVIRTRIRLEWIEGDESKPEQRLSVHDRQGLKALKRAD